MFVCLCIFRCLQYLEEGDSCETVTNAKYPDEMCGPGLGEQQSFWIIVTVISIYIKSNMDTLIIIAAERQEKVYLSFTVVIHTLINAELTYHNFP